jgi:aryl-alcohol dehydrogenase-like predicted oxidoreductase
LNTNSKLILGTVQFGLEYGINNFIGIPTGNEIARIFRIANISGIEMLDTASIYGDSERRIGELSRGDFKVYSKFSKVTTEEELYQEFQLSLANLRSNSIYGYMAHNADTLIENPKIWSVLQKLKSENKINKIGYSLYSTEQLITLLDIELIPDFIQVPYSLLDRKFDLFFLKLKKMGVEIHARSIFLQGLYFMNPDKLTPKLFPLKPELEKLRSYCNIYNVEIGSLALNFVMANPNIDKIVIGVDSSTQLQKNIDSIKSWKPNKKLIDSISSLDVENSELLNPSNW